MSMTPSFRATALATLLLLARSSAATAEPPGKSPLLLQSPSLSSSEIAFAYAGDLWAVPRGGGVARRLTAGSGIEARPLYSPDGASIAFSGEYDGNVDVYVMAAAGGTPRRLTWHPGEDVAVAWTPDGSGILFRSGRASGTDDRHLYRIAASGGVPERLPLPAAETGSFSPDGRRLAYVPYEQWQPAWKRYRGGQTTPIWIVDLTTLAVEKIPRDGSNDRQPIWIGDEIFFLSDRDGPVGLYSYDTRSRSVRRRAAPPGFDLKSAGGGPGGIAIEQFGALHLLDLASGTLRRVEVQLAADLPAIRPHWVDVSAEIQSAALSPTGARALFAARGDLFTVPAEKGDIRSLTHSSSAADRDPAWSPDGKTIAWLSDESGEVALHLTAANGFAATRRIALGDPPSFFYSPVWSPDSKWIALHDKRLTLWLVEVASGHLARVDQDDSESPERTLDPAWSPDSRFLAYSKKLPSQLRAIFVYSLADASRHQVTDGMSDARHPAFDHDGKSLAFTASTDVGLTASWLDLSSYRHPVTRSVYAVVLARDTASPLAPLSDEEKGPTESADAKADADDSASAVAPVVRIDWERLPQRTVALPVDAANYVGLAAGKAGELFLLEGPEVADADAEGPPPVRVVKFTYADRKTTVLLESAERFVLSSDGEKMLWLAGDIWSIAATAEAPEEGKGALVLSTMRPFVDPRAEWRQMYREVWRLERDFLYDPGHHGLDLGAAERLYAPFLDGIAHRADLNTLFEEMLGNLVLGHVFVGGGDLPAPPETGTGLLGADFTVERGRYRFARIFDGESWNPELKAPLTQPGAEVHPGEYLLAIDGRDVRPPAAVESFLEQTADRTVVLRVGPDPEGSGARDVAVVPVASEHDLRYRAWVEDNRRTVDRLSGGRLAYLHLPDTGGGGFDNFNRYFFAQTDKQGAIVDERFNHGGQLADYVIDLLDRPRLSWLATRDGREMPSPGGAIDGPKVMLINEMSGSGGDALPWYFRKVGLGPLVGTRTWGGLVGIYDYPVLLDGGQVTAPRVAIYGLDGAWEVENVGVAPDVEVERLPADCRDGRDPQLERAVALLLERLSQQPPKAPRRPPYPVYRTLPTSAP